MKNCKYFRQQLIVATYQELATEEQELLHQHLAQCPACRAEAAALTTMMNRLRQKLQLEPTDQQLDANRAELHRRLVLAKEQSHSGQLLAKIWQLVSLDFAPTLRLATALGMLAIGLFLGRIFFAQARTTAQSQLIELAESNLSHIEAIEYDPQTRQVAIQLSAINQVTIEGDLEEAEIQRLLAQVLVYDERPNIRLKTVRALERIRHFDREMVTALSNLVDKEENPGIRLRAMKLLIAMPLNLEMKDMLLALFSRVLLKDTNSAIRIAAFEGLVRVDDAAARPLIMNVAKKDTSEYIQLRAKHVLARIENPEILNKEVD